MAIPLLWILMTVGDWASDDLSEKGSLSWWRFGHTKPICLTGAIWFWDHGDSLRACPEVWKTLVVPWKPSVRQVAFAGVSLGLILMETDCWQL